MVMGGLGCMHLSHPCGLLCRLWHPKRYRNPVQLSRCQRPCSTWNKYFQMAASTFRGTLTTFPQVGGAPLYPGLNYPSQCTSLISARFLHCNIPIHVAMADPIS